MKTIVITGPSCSGKSYLSKKLSKIFINSILLETDSYYRDNILIKFLSNILYDIYDRPVSIMKKELSKTIKSIYIKDRLISYYKYDFRGKRSSKSKKIINYKQDNQYLIVEGIFAHRLDLNYQNTVNIVCYELKENCYKRRLERDQLERGRDIREVNKKFNKSWYLYNRNIKKFLNSNKVIYINTYDKNSYTKLVCQLKNN